MDNSEPLRSSNMWEVLTCVDYECQDDYGSEGLRMIQHVGLFSTHAGAADACRALRNLSQVNNNEYEVDSWGDRGGLDPRKIAFMFRTGGLANGESGSGAPGGVHHCDTPPYLSEDVNIQTRAGGGKFFGVRRAQIFIKERPVDRVVTHANLGPTESGVRGSGYAELCTPSLGELAAMRSRKSAGGRAPRKQLASSAVTRKNL